MKKGIIFLAIALIIILSFYFLGIPYIGNVCKIKGEEFFYKREYARAIKYLKVANKILKDSDKPIILTGIGCAYMNLYEYGSAIKAFKQAIQLDDKCERASAGLVDTLIKIQKYDEAEEWAKKRLKISTGGISYLELASIYRLKGEPEKALSYVMSKIAFDENIVGKSSDEERIASRLLFADIFTDLGKYDEAVDVLISIQEDIDPKNPRVFKMLAYLYELKGEKEKALENWKSLLVLDEYKDYEYAQLKVDQLSKEIAEESVASK